MPTLRCPLCGVRDDSEFYVVRRVLQETGREPTLRFARCRHKPCRREFVVRLRETSDADVAKASRPP